MRRVIPIVEGYSEANSIPAFLRRLLQDAEIYDVIPGRAIREQRTRLVKRDVFLNRLRMATLQEDCCGIIVLIDADDDPACQLAPHLLELAQECGLSVPCRVVLAVRETESWLMAGAESLRGVRGLSEDVTPPKNVESIRGAREWLNAHMHNGYKATIDQLPLLQKFDYEQARLRSPSLDKFLRDVHSLIETR